LEHFFFFSFVVGFVVVFVVGGGFVVGVGLGPQCLRLNFSSFARLISLSARAFTSTSAVSDDVFWQSMFQQSRNSLLTIKHLNRSFLLPSRHGK
jgi:hypothetical protein